MLLVLSLLLAAVTLMLVSLQKTYSSAPAKELKRRARSGDEVAELLYRAVGYGASLRLVLWLGIGLAAAGFFVTAGEVMPKPLALTLSVGLIWAGFVWLPAGKVTKLGTWFASHAAPILAKLLNYLHPIVDRLVGFVRRHRPLHIHTGLYDKTDLLQLLERQQVQADNRIGQVELDIAKHALGFGDKIVRDIMTPRRIVKMVAAGETVGPVLMSELHDSGHSRFPVYEGNQDLITGTLFLRDLMQAKAGGKVGSIMHAGSICYIHEEQPLTEALQAILKTRRHLLIVVNSFEEYVGVVSVEDVLEQIIGSPIVDEFDQYEDLRAVAKRIASKEHAQNHDDQA